MLNIALLELIFGFNGINDFTGMASKEDEGQMFVRISLVSLEQVADIGFLGAMGVQDITVVMYFKIASSVKNNETGSPLVIAFCATILMAAMEKRI